ncbi:MAG TPA: phytase, partial [Xanthomonadaceae bacterium]|nr:phytase [Xanthomonadaceae bacterium]
MRLPALSAAALLLAACTLPPPRPTSPAPAAAAVPSALAAAWSSASAPAGAIASWTDEDGGPRVITTTPDGRLAIRDGDTGALLDDPRAATLRFDDPAAIAVFGDHLFVAERGRHRVQVLSLPAFAPVASMGADALVAPAGLWLD